MKKILIPTDFSEVSQNAFVHALNFANTIKGELILLHTFEIPVMDSQFSPESYYLLYESMQLTDMDLFKDEVAKLKVIADTNKLGHIKMQHKLTDGGLTDNLQREIEEQEIDFVVMGTANELGWDTFFTGTHTGAAISSIKIPLLSVPKKAKYQKIERIGFTTRYREKDKIALQKVIAIAKKMKSEIYCLYVKTSQSDVDKNTILQWEKEFSGERVHFLVIPSDDVEGTIIDYIQHKSIDVLAMSIYKRSFFSELFHSSMSRKITTNLNIPVLVLHE